MTGTVKHQRIYSSPFYSLAIIPNLSDKASTSSIEWVVRITALFFYFLDILLMTDHINLLDFGSIPAEGSSRRMIGGLPRRAMATESFLLFPPLRVSEGLHLCSSKFNSLIFYSIKVYLLSLSMPLMRA